MPPPKGVNESWNEFTDPVDVTVVEAANSDDPGVPKTTFLAFHRAMARGAGAIPGALGLEEADAGRTAASQMITMTASSA